MSREVEITTYKPLITVKEARKLLGSKFKSLDDNQVQELINNLSLMARKSLKIVGSKNTHGCDNL